MILASQLHSAIRKGDAHLAKQLIRDGAPLHDFDEEGLTALHYAVSNCNDPAFIEVVRMLIEHGADVNAINSWGRDPDGKKCYAIFTGRTRPLHFAAMNQTSEAAKLLLEAGAWVDAPNDEQWTPLHMTARAGVIDIVRLLVAHGAKSDVKADCGTTPLELAERYLDSANYQECAKLMRQTTRDASHPSTKSFLAATNRKSLGSADVCKQQVAAIMALVSQHRSDDAKLQSAIAELIANQRTSTSVNRSRDS